MTREEQEKFKKEFQSIVGHRYVLKQNEDRLKQLHVWDRNDSHKSAIIKACEQRDRIKTILAEALKGRSYDDWLKMSTKISRLNGRMKNAIATQNRIEKEFEELIF